MLISHLIPYLSLCNPGTTSPLCRNACPKLTDYPYRFVTKECYINPNAFTLMPKLIEINGYPSESHKVTTGDGYILTLFRIPPKADDNRKKKQPVFIIHGVLSDSALFVFTGERSLALNLAAQGYDVWLGNERGSRYSRGHTTLKDTDNEYWEYNMDDVAANDIRYSLRKIANVTGGAGSIIYMGHSRGSTLVSMYGSEFPEEAHQMLKGVIAISPVIYGDVAPAVKLFLDISPLIIKFDKMLKINGIFGNLEFFINLTQLLCTFMPHICRLVVTVFLGRTGQFSPNDLLLFYSNIPTSISLGEYEQYVQFYQTKQFQKFDFGKEENLKKYGQEKPPLYNLGNIKFPVVSFFGTHDTLISTKSVGRYASELGSKRKEVYTLPVGNDTDKYQFNHIDVYMSEYLQEFFYPYLFKVLSSSDYTL